jgi:hypothetical protein
MSGSKPLFVICLAAAAIAPQALAQDVNAKLSFRHNAASTASVLAELSKASGIRMDASVSVASDVLVVSVKDATVSDVMRQIAGALHAEWTQGSAGNYTLSRSQSMALKDVRAEQAERAAALARGIARNTAAVKAQGKFDDEAAKKLAKANQEMMDRMMSPGGAPGTMRVTGGPGGDMAAKSPAGRAITNILSQLGTSQLASMVTGNRVVFSNHPTRMQLALPNGAIVALEQFVREQKLYAEAQQAVRKADDGRRFIISGLGDSETGAGDARLGLGTALLVVDPGPGRNPTVQLLVTDRNGGVLARGSMSLPMETQAPKPTEVKFDGEKPIELSDLALEFSKTVQGPGGAPGQRMVRVALAAGSDSFEMSGDPMARPPMKTSKELRERILNPEKYEPLALAPGEAFSAVVDGWGKNLVAYLPDDLLVPVSSQLAAGKVTPSQFLTNVQTDRDLGVTVDGEWMTIAPRHHAAALGRKVIRAALGKALRNLEAQGYLNLNDLGSFALAQPKQLGNGDFDFAYMRLVNAGFADQVLSRYSFGGGWGMLRFYATLTGPQKQALGNQQQLPFANLTAQQMDMLTDQVFNSFDGPEVQNPDQPQDSRFPGMRFAFGTDIRTERTIVLPNGLQRNGFITLNLSSTPAVQGVNTQSGSSNLMTAASLAWARLQQERPEMLAGLGFTPSLPDRFRTATQSSYRFTFALAPQVVLNRSLQDAFLNKNGALVAYEALPADFRDTVEKTLDRLRSSVGRGIPGGNPVRPPVP